MNLSLFYNEDESFVRILDSNDDLFLEGEYSSNFTISSETEINGETADCLTEITDGDCDEVPAGYECFDDMLYQRCESANFECNIYWDFD